MATDNVDKGSPSAPSYAGTNTDYGGTFTTEEEDLLATLLTQYNVQRSEKECLAADLELLEQELQEAEPAENASDIETASTSEGLVQGGKFSAKVEIAVPLDGKSAPTAGTIPSPSPVEEVTAQKSSRSPPPDASRPYLAPLDRFRAWRPLSVTDLVSPAWCELQYSYSLLHHGRKRRTRIMQVGSAIHQKLEDEAHATFHVSVFSKEDAWALKVWNVIQGARSLAENGLTREMEIWGVIDGQVITGIIDELSYECPDAELEAHSQAKSMPLSNREAGQQTIEEFLGGNRTDQAAAGTSPEGSKVYLKDVKTRTAKGIPRGSALRPTELQLMLYRRLLHNLLADPPTFDAQAIWDRYGVDSNRSFSYSFIDQFNDEEDSDHDGRTPVHSQESLPDTEYATSTPLETSELSKDYNQRSEPHTEHPTSSSSTQDTDRTALKLSLEDLHVLLRLHPTLRDFWSRMVVELRRAIPSLGQVLQAEYRSQINHEVVGNQMFVYNSEDLDAHLQDAMQWWLGERSPRGVQVADVWKCRKCDFAEDCTWRKEKIEEDLQRFRSNTSATA